MRRVFALAFGSLFAVFPADAKDRPPRITWDWYHAAEIYRNHQGVRPEDLRLAARYHRMAAERGNAASAYKLAEMYENGAGVTQSYKNALNWYRRSAEHGDKHAEFRLGFLHQKGLGTPVNLAAAISWYERAARQDNEWAYHMLAFMYADGEGVRRDLKKARALFEKSLPRTQDSWAQFKLASLIAKDDPARARRLLRQSAAAGNADAIKMLAERGW